MSLLVTLTVQADPAKAEQVLKANADRLQKIIEQAQGMGCVSGGFEVPRSPWTR